MVLATLLLASLPLLLEWMVFKFIDEDSELKAEEFALGCAVNIVVG